MRHCTQIQAGQYSGDSTLNGIGDVFDTHNWSDVRTSDITSYAKADWDVLRA